MFDLDDTLYRTRRFVLSGFVAVADHLLATRRIARRHSLAVLVGAARRSRAREALQECCHAFDLGDPVVAELLGVFRAHQPSLRLSRPARQVLAACRAHARVGILTNGDPDMQRRKVMALGLADHVDAVVFAHAHHPDGKPAPEVFAAAHAALGCPGDMTMVGDNWECDIEGALAVGWRAAWLAPAGWSACRDVPSSVIRISRLGEFASVAENIWGGTPVRLTHEHWPVPHRP